MNNNWLTNTIMAKAAVVVVKTAVDVEMKVVAKAAAVVVKKNHVRMVHVAAKCRFFLFRKYFNIDIK